MNFKLQGKTAIIGGSSRGLGKSCAVSLAREGANIVLCARNEDALHEAQCEIEALGVPTLALVADMSSADDNLRIVRETVARGATLFALVTIRSFVPTVRASASNVAIRQKLTSFFIVVLFAFLLGKFVFIIERAEKVGRCFTMNSGSCTGIYIKGDSKLGE